MSSEIDTVVYGNTENPHDSFDLIDYDGTTSWEEGSTVSALVLIHQSDNRVGFIDVQKALSSTQDNTQGYYVLSDPRANIYRPTGPMSFSYGTDGKSAYITYSYIVWKHVIGHVIKVLLDNFDDIDKQNVDDAGSSSGSNSNDPPSITFDRHITANMYLSRYMLYPTAAYIHYSGSNDAAALNGYVEIEYGSYNPAIGTNTQLFKEGYVQHYVRYKDTTLPSLISGINPVHVSFEGLFIPGSGTSDLAWQAVKTLGTAANMNTLATHTLCFPMYLSKPSLQLEDWFANPEQFCSSNYMRPYMRAQNISAFESRLQANIPFNVPFFGGFTLIGLMIGMGMPRSYPSFENFYDAQFTDKATVTTYLGYNTTEFYSTSLYKYYILYGTNENHYITFKSDHGIITVQFRGQAELKSQYEVYYDNGQPFSDVMFYNFNSITPEEYFYADAFVWAKHQFRYDEYEVYNHSRYSSRGKAYGPANHGIASNIIFGSFNIEIPPENLQGTCDIILSDEGQILIDSMPLSGNNIHVVETMNQSIDIYDSWDPPEGRVWSGSVYSMHDHVSSTGTMSSIDILDSDTKILIGVSTQYGILQKIQDLYVQYIMRDIPGAGSNCSELNDSDSDSNFSFYMYSVISMMDDWDTTLADMCIAPQLMTRRRSTTGGFILPTTNWAMGFNRARTDIMTRYYSKTGHSFSFVGIKTLVTVNISSDNNVPIIENASYSTVGVPFGTGTACWSCIKVQPPGENEVPILHPLLINSLSVVTNIEEQFDIPISPSIGMVVKIETYNGGVFTYDEQNIHLIGTRDTAVGPILASLSLNTGHDHIYIDRFDQLLSSGVGDKLLSLYNN